MGIRARDEVLQSYSEELRKLRREIDTHKVYTYPANSFNIYDLRSHIFYTAMDDYANFDEDDAAYRDPHTDGYTTAMQCMGDIIALIIGSKMLARAEARWGRNNLIYPLPSLDTLKELGRKIVGDFIKPYGEDDEFFYIATTSRFDPTLHLYDFLTRYICGGAIPRDLDRYKSFDLSEEFDLSSGIPADVAHADILASAVLSCLDTFDRAFGIASSTSAPSIVWAQAK